MKRRLTSLLAAALVLLLAVPALAAKDPPAPPHPVSMTLDPPRWRLDRPGASQRLLVRARFSDGSLRDVTKHIKFFSADPKKVWVTLDGRAHPQADGVTRVVAVWGKLRARGFLEVTNSEVRRPLTFHTDISPMLTQLGCNNSSCHGGPVGKGGFKLSLFGYYPDEDYQAIAKAGKGRRVNLQEPAESLLLKKTTLAMPHGGGRRVEPGSREHQTLLAWIASGAPASASNEARLERLEIYPRRRVLTIKKQTQRFLVSAVYDDGTREDVTDRAVFTGNDDSVAEVDAEGVVTAAGTGETPILARFGGKVAIGIIAATALPPLQDFPDIPEGNLVDRHIFAKLKDLRLPPSPECTDAEFLRRASLDIIATLPTPEEARAFIADTDPDKRAKLVDGLLGKPEYGDYQALLWADRLRSNSRFHRTKGVKSYQKWLKESFQANMPMDQFARALVTAQGKNYTVGPANFWGAYDRTLDPEELAPMASQLFMGVRIHCAQCHDHPFDRWTMNDFYSLSAVFAQVKTKLIGGQEFELSLDAKVQPVENPRSGKPRLPAGLGAPLEVKNGEDARGKFADWLTARDNPYFAQAIVNKLWKQFMGRGLVEPVDDFRVTNPATHPELLGELAQELIRARFDQKRVIRLICNSRAYQASSQANDVNRGDHKYYARAYAKRLMAEVYLDAVQQTTGKWDTFKKWPEATRYVQLPDNRYGSHFLETFGRSNRLVICERDEVGTVAQALNMINGGDIQGRVASKDGTLAKLLASKKPDSEVMDELFLATLSRFPTPEERSRLARQTADVPRQEAFEDVFWALLVSREFQFNH